MRPPASKGRGIRVMRGWGGALAAAALIAGCSAPMPPTPATYSDGLNPGLALHLDAGGEAIVEEFPGVPPGECIGINNWPSSVLQSGRAEWSMEDRDTLRITGAGWEVRLQYVWRRGSPDFTELRYPTCGADGESPYFLLTRN